MIERGARRYVVSAAARRARRHHAPLALACALRYHRATWSATCLPATERSAARSRLRQQPMPRRQCDWNGAAIRLAPVSPHTRRAVVPLSCRRRRHYRTGA